MKPDSVVCIDHARLFPSEKGNPLSARGYQCSISANTQEALTLATERQVDAIVLRCPCGAAQLVMQIRSINPTIPIILLRDESVEACPINQFEVAVDAALSERTGT
jgi:DNA-binding response OmpR family regulator